MIDQNVYTINSATFNLTQQCNLSCSYCFCGDKTIKKMSFETAKKSVDWLIKNVMDADINTLNGKKRTMDISFWGGEPLLEWKLLKKIILYTKSVIPNGMLLQFGGTTNGTLLTPEKFDFLQEHRLMFMVSLDGTQETHDVYRLFKNGKGSHAIIMKNMEQVLKKWPFYKTRVSLYPGAIGNFYKDIEYLFEHGMYNIMFSPVYEHKWTEDTWNTWINESYKVVDLMEKYKNKGIKTTIEHFKSYMNIDNSNWPCGAGRHYIGIDTDGSIWPCHRFIKFDDTRPWQEKEMCIGHVDIGITKPDIRQKFIDYIPTKCGDCEFSKNTPCHGGCYAANFDLEKDITKSHSQICDYVKAQKKISLYYKEKFGDNTMENNGKSCICNNMCYLEGTKEEIIDIDDSGIQCHCNNANYTGSLEEGIAKPLKRVQINPMDILRRVEKLEKNLIDIDSKLDKILEKI